MRRRTPLRTGRASLPASGSSKPSRSGGARPYDPLSIEWASAGPFTATVVAASNLSVGSGIGVIFSCWVHLTVSAPFRTRPQGLYPAGYPRRPTGGLALLSWFPVAFRPPAFASRSSCSRRGIGPSSRSAYRPTAGPRQGFPRSARTSSDRGGRPLCPGDNGAHPDQGHFPAGRLPLRNGQSLHPATHPTDGVLA